MEMTIQAGGVPARYTTRPCLWCLRFRAECAPNTVNVAVENSDGICPSCVQAMKDESRRGRTSEIGK